MTETQKWLSKFKTLQYKNYGYEGKEMLLKWSDPPHAVWENVWLPIKIIKEYPRWLLVEVQPHVNGNLSLRMSSPYRMGVNKMSLILGDYKIKERGKK